MTKVRADEPAKSDDLSQSARAVVHDAGDPRIDAHLRALGLAPDAAEPIVKAPPAAPSVSPELLALRARVDDLEAALLAAGRRVRWLAIALAVALIAIVAFALLLAVRG